MFSRRPTTSPRPARCTSPSTASITTGLLLSLLALSAAPAVATGHTRQDAQVVFPIEASPLIPPLLPEPPAPAQHTFTLRHIYHHGTNRHPTLHRKMDAHKADADVWLAAEDGYAEERIGPLVASSAPVQIQRLRDRRPSVVDPMVAMARQRGYVSVLSPEAWTMDHVAGPNITDKGTVLSLALMASNAYIEKPGPADWEEVGAPFNRSADFGWESDGLRGHVWADETNSTIVIGLKGTSPAVFDGDGTTTNDKVNDNLFFSCCCAQQGPWTWHQVCDCATGTYSCNNTCVVQALREENRYYQAARELYANVTELYPNSKVWLAGHSLGGAVSSMLGLTYGVPVVTFEAVPEALPAGRLGLPVPPGSNPDAPQTREFTGAYHFGHTADPIYIGTCNGATASCSFGGYALESSCHTGRECVYDTVGDKGWRVGLGTHKIRSVIHDVIMKYDTVPECKFTPECRDCGSWKMYESNGTEPITSTSSSTSTSKTRTRTETCKTPGWWGCLDETTTGTATTTDTTTTTTTTCLTPGWFGCKDRTTTTSTITTTKPATPTETTSSTTCLTPGRFWGCDDEPVQTSTPFETTTCLTPGRFYGCADEPTSSTSDSSDSTTCLTPGVIWGCHDKTSTMISDPIQGERATITEPPVLPTSTTPPSDSHKPKKPTCLRRAWYGLCREWDDGAPADAKEDM